MPRPSLNPDRAKQGGGGVEAGNYEVLAATFKNHKTDYRVNQLTLMLDLATLDKDGDRVRGADPIELPLSFGQKSLEVFHPGQGNSIDDADPKDVGTDVDAEGNTIYCKSEGDQFNGSCAAMVFQKSLAAQGFPKDLLDKCWAQTYVGLKFSLDTMDPKTCNDKFGTRLNTKPFKDDEGNERPITYKIAKAWLNPNYLGQTSNGTGAAKNAAPASSSAGNATQSSAPASAEDIAIACLRKVANTKKGAKNAIKTKSSLAGFFVNAFATGKFKGDLKEVRSFVENEEWVTNQVLELGGELDIDGETGQWTGKITFPE